MLTQEQKQETVNRVVAFMAKQREPSHNGESCAYLEQNRQCAIGCLLTEEQCIEAENKAYSVTRIVRLGWNGWAHEDGNFLSRLQSCHDEAYVEMMEEEVPFLVSFDTYISEFCKHWKLVHPGGLELTEAEEVDE